MTRTVKPPSLRSRKRQLVQDAIWDAAIDLFGRKGYDQTTVEEIVAAAGVSSRSFFRYFASKSDLMAQGMVEYGALMAATIEACPRSWSLQEVFRHTVVDVARRTAEAPRTRRTIAVGEKYPAALAAELARLPEVQHRVARAYAGRRANGSDDGMTSALLAALTFDVVGLALLTWFHDRQQDVAKTAGQAFRTLERLVAPPRRPK
jgi:AcrR family transcriptional regulator